MRRLKYCLLILAACVGGHSAEAPAPDGGVDAYGHQCPAGWGWAGDEIGCVAPWDAAPAPDALPAQVGSFCAITCDAKHWDAPGGGDDQCRAALGGGTSVGCCLDDGTCWYGERLEPACLGLAPPPTDETCPNDVNGNGLCYLGGRIYRSCS